MVVPIGSLCAKLTKAAKLPNDSVDTFTIHIGALVVFLYAINENRWQKRLALSKNGMCTSTATHQINTSPTICGTRTGLNKTKRKSYGGAFAAALYSCVIFKIWIWAHAFFFPFVVF